MRVFFSVMALGSASLIMAFGPLAFFRGIAMIFLGLLFLVLGASIVFVFATFWPWEIKAVTAPDHHRFYGPVFFAPKKGDR